MSKKKAKELTSNPLKAQPKPKARKGEIPLWKVCKWSLKHPNQSPFIDKPD